MPGQAQPGPASAAIVARSAAAAASVWPSERAGRFAVLAPARPCCRAAGVSCYRPPPQALCSAFGPGQPTGRLWPTAIRPQGMRAECALTIRQPDGRLNLPTTCTPAGCRRAVPARAAGGRQPIHPGEPPQPRRRPSGPLHEFDQPLRRQPACERERAGDRFVVPGVMARWCRSKTPGHHAGRGRGSGRPQTGLRPTRCPPAPADRRARPPARPQRALRIWKHPQQVPGHHHVEIFLRHLIGPGLDRGHRELLRRRSKW